MNNLTFYFFGILLFRVYSYYWTPLKPGRPTFSPIIRFFQWQTSFSNNNNNNDINNTFLRNLALFTNFNYNIYNNNNNNNNVNVYKGTTTYFSTTGTFCMFNELQNYIHVMVYSFRINATIHVSTSQPWKLRGNDSLLTPHTVEVHLIIFIVYLSAANGSHTIGREITGEKLLDVTHWGNILYMSAKCRILEIWVEIPSIFFYKSILNLIVFCHKVMFANSSILNKNKRMWNNYSETC